MLRTLLASCCLIFSISSFAQETSPDLRTGFYRGQKVTYKVMDGMAVHQGDMILGTPEQLAVSTITPESFGTVYQSSLWPQQNGIYTVPYVILTGTPAL